MSEYTELRRELRKYLSKEQIDIVREAYRLAKQAHGDQKRSSGEPYITHPLSVATILAKMRLDPDTIAAAILHDVLEDTPVNKEKLVEAFGEEVADLVDGVTKLTQMSFGSRAEAQAESFRKMMLAMSRDIRVILIKLADRLHNMRTLGYVNATRRARIAHETLEIYAPITNRLGMYGFMIELEDLSFSALYPRRYQVLSDAVKKARGNRREILSIIDKSLKACVKRAGFPKLKIFGREKHLYSIYRKMRQKHLRFSDVMDVYAFRVITDDVDTCYRVLGVVHNIYKPVSERFKDFIAIPKSNGYQALHTTLFGPYGVPIEIQIRTKEMDQVAENGIAAHWLYKSQGSAISKTQLRAREWVKEILEIQQSTGSSLEFIENVKVDLFPDEVYVFTPKGDIQKLQQGSTPIDFAYAVHTEVGNNCIAAKFNRRLVPLSMPLKSGQTVEIITAPGARPNPNWLNFVVTGKAKSGIRHFLKSQQRSESVTLGKHLLEKALRKASVDLKSIGAERYQDLLKELHCETLDDLYEQVGLGNHMPQLIVHRLSDQADRFIEEKSAGSQGTEPLSIKGTEGMVLTFAKCCHPIPGDAIEGVMSAGRGIVVHGSSCKNLSPMRNHPEKCVSLRWEDETEGEFDVALRVEIMDQRGALASLALAVADVESNIKDIHLEKESGGYSVDYLIVTVRNRVHLARLIRRVRQLTHVLKISRQRE